MKSLLIIATLFLSTFFSQAQSVQTPAKFKSSLNQMLDEYLEMEEALLSGNSEKAGEEAKELNEVMSKMKTDSLTKEQLASFQKQAAKIQHNAEHIEENNKNYPHQLEHFDYLTDEFYSLLKAFSFNNKPIYYNYTKEGNEGNSAHWLTDKDDLKNPYFKGAVKNTDKRIEIFK